MKSKVRSFVKFCKPIKTRKITIRKSAAQNTAEILATGVVNFLCKRELFSVTGSIWKI